MRACMHADLVPRHDPGSVVNRFLDLAATEEDHNEVRFIISPHNA